MVAHAGGLPPAIAPGRKVVAAGTEAATPPRVRACSFLLFACFLSVGCDSQVVDDGEGGSGGEGGQGGGCPAEAPDAGASCDLADMTECRYKNNDSCVVTYRCEPVFPEEGAPSEWVDLGQIDPSCGCVSEMCAAGDDAVAVCPAGFTCYEVFGCDAPTLCAASGSILGAKHDGDCTTANEFASACEAAGGVLGDNCQDAGCGGPGYFATCFEPPPQPTASEFSCGGLFNCDVGELCHLVNPIADGCFVHTCEPPPSACAQDVSCACLETSWGDSFLGCEEDATGNPTVSTSPF